MKKVIYTMMIIIGLTQVLNGGDTKEYGPISGPIEKPMEPIR